MKEIKQHTSKGKETSCSWAVRINVVKMSILLKAIYIFNIISIKFQWHFLQKYKKTIIKFIWSHKIPPQTKAVLRKKSKSRGIIPPDFKLYYKAIVSKQYGSRIKNRDIMEQHQEYSQLKWALSQECKDSLISANQSM